MTNILNKIIDNPRLFWPFFTLVLLSGSGWIWFSTVENPEALTAAPFTGFLAPDFTLETLDGESVTLSDLRGQVVVLNLWASWCGPCRAEMPAMDEVYDGGSDPAFEILAVNMTYQDEAAAAAEFANELGLTFPILLDQTGTVGPIYRLEALPTTFFIDREGVIRDIVPGGPMNQSLIRSKIQALLDEEAG